MFYQQTILDNGITVITERMDSVASVALGMWVRVGSRDETTGQAGMSHFMEHMMFKGTPTRTAMDISRSFDAMGAELNAFTSKETTCYYARFLDAHLEEAFTILADMVVNSTFTDEDISSEREVVLEEIARTTDTPEDYVFDVASDALWPTAPLGRPVLGHRDTVSLFDHADCAAYHTARYTASNLVVSAAGNLDHDEIVRLAQNKLGGLFKGKRLTRVEHPAQTNRPMALLKRETEQAHVVYTLPYLPANDPDRFAATLLDSVLGGGMSSRLFQEVREKRGLVYAIYTYASSYEGAGSYGVYAGTRPANIEQVVAITVEELRKMHASGVSAEELARAKESSIGQLALAMESPRQHMVMLGRNRVLDHDLLSIEETEERVRAVRLEDVSRVADRVFSGVPTLAIISNMESDQLSGCFADQDVLRP
jgi:predicted Zn-dependent peptidase